MITTITLNPAIDRTVELEKIELGEVNRVKETREDLGGKSINVARLLKGYGTQVAAIFFAGKDNWETVAQYIKKDQLDVNVVLVEGKTRTNTKIVEIPSSRTTDINEAGFEISEEKYQELLKLVAEKAEQSDYVVMSGSLPPSLSAETYKELGTKLRGKTKVVLDADGEVLMEGLKASPYLIKPNIHELEAALKCKFEGIDSIVEGTRKLLLQYDIEYALVSMGIDGSVLVTKDKALKAEAIRVEVKSTVGAGDAMLAGFIYSLQQGFSLERALANGVASSTLTISHHGLLKYSADELKEYADKVQISYV